MGIDPDRKPAKKNNKKGSNNGKREKVPFGSSRFARIELTESEKADYRLLLDNNEFSLSIVQSWLDSGYKLSLVKDDNGGGVVAVLSPVFSDVENAGLQLSARAGHWENALHVLEYKDLYVAGEDGWLACESLRSRGTEDIG